ncbi:MAG: ABC transporter substrate binding protein, partial [Pseudolabrys sp.]
RCVTASVTQRNTLVKELVALHPEVILAHSTPVAAVVQRETHEIPVVFVNVSDPVGAGFVVSLARPGANLTGVLQYEPGIVSKWLSMLKEIRMARARQLPISDLILALFGSQSKDTCQPSLAVLEQRGGLSVTKKSDDRNWIEQPVHRWGSCGAIVCSYRFAQRNWKHSCRSTNIPRTMGANIMGLLPCRDCRLLPKLRCLFWGLNAGVAN